MKEVSKKINEQKNIINVYIKVIDVSVFIVFFWLIISYLILLDVKNVNYTYADKIVVFLMSLLFTFALLYRISFMTIGQIIKKLKNSEKVRKEWVEDISHDIKVPLSTIKGYAEIMQSEIYDFEMEEIKFYGSQILDSEKRIEDMVEEMKLSIKLENDKIILAKENINISELIFSCVNEFNSKLDGNSKIIYNIKKDYYIYCDRILIKRCIENILQNAFIHNNKNIELKINIKKNNKKLYISIKDNGRGIFENDLKHIFERYYRGKGTDKIKGQGLGMAITYEIIKAHKGNIKVRSEINKGTEFIIELES